MTLRWAEMQSETKSKSFAGVIKSILTPRKAIVFTDRPGTVIPGTQFALIRFLLKKKAWLLNVAVVLNVVVKCTLPFGDVEELARRVNTTVNTMSKAPN
jgi:hypothetical protein